jgi:pyruvate dehydrogenase E2 component (dihydrolipoamide acetyltransferase)
MTHSPGATLDFSEFGSTRREKLGRIQLLTAQHLSRSWNSIPHVTHHDLADITSVESRRQEWNQTAASKLTLLPILVKALVASLQAFPRFNASLDGDTLVLKDYVNIGVAVDTGAGLLVPVIRACDYKTVTQIAAEVTVLVESARTKGLPMSALSGGCMTISSLGSIGGIGFTPIINAPEIAILGVSKAEWVPRRDVVVDLGWRLMLPLSLSYDHRAVNGADAARFVRDLASRLNETQLA